MAGMMEKVDRKPPAVGTDGGKEKYGRPCGKRSVLTAAAAVLMFSSALSLLPAGTARAATPEFARTEEEWARLRDDTLEFAEIPDLIAEYNQTAKDSDYDASKDGKRARNAAEIKENLLSQADDYDVMAEEARQSTGGAVLAASYKMMANSLREQAEDNVTDGRILSLEHERTKAQLTKEAKLLFIDCYASSAAEKAQNTDTAYLEKLLEGAQARLSAGAGTETEVLTARRNLADARAALIDAGEESARKRFDLIVMCGWKGDAQAVLGEMPEDPTAAVSGLNYETDLAAALGNSFTLRADGMRSENALKLYGSESSVTKKYSRTEENDRQTCENSFRSLYDQLMAAKAAYDSCAASENAAKTACEAAQRGYDGGTVSRNELYAKQNALDNAADSREQAYYRFHTAWQSYLAARDGLL